MIKKGIISKLNPEKSKAEVFFPDLDDGVTTELPVATSIVGLLTVRDVVVVVFFSNSLSDGVVIAALGTSSS